MTKLQALVAKMVRENWINGEDDPETANLRKDLLPYIRKAYFLGRADERAIRKGKR